MTPKQLHQLASASFDLMANRCLYSQGWRLAYKVDPKTQGIATLPIPPKAPVPQGFDRVLSQQIPTRA